VRIELRKINYGLTRKNVRKISYRLERTQLQKLTTVWGE